MIAVVPILHRLLKDLRTEERPLDDIAMLLRCLMRRVSTRPWGSVCENYVERDIAFSGSLNHVPILS